jgi:hypothetical protein
MRKYVLEVTDRELEILFVHTPEKPTPWWHDDDEEFKPSPFTQEEHDSLTDKIEEAVDRMFADDRKDREETQGGTTDGI